VVIVATSKGAAAADAAADAAMQVIPHSTTLLTISLVSMLSEVTYPFSFGSECPIITRFSRDADWTGKSY